MLPADEQPRLATELLAREFGPGLVGPMDVLVEAPGGVLAPGELERIDDLTRRLSADPDVAEVQSVTSFFPSAQVASATLSAGLQALPPQLAGALQARVNWDIVFRQTTINLIGEVAHEGRRRRKFGNRRCMTQRLRELKQLPAK